MSNITDVRGVPCLLWPIAAFWRLLTGLIGLAGRLVVLAIGFVFMVVGMVLTFTVVGAIVGIPLVLLGIVLIVRSIF